MRLNKSLMVKAFFALTCVAFVLVFIFGVFPWVILQLNSALKTESFNLYENNELGLSLVYPTSFIEKKSSSIPFEEGVFTPFLVLQHEEGAEVKAGTFPFSLSLMGSKRPEGSSLGDFYENYSPTTSCQPIAEENVFSSTRENFEFQGQAAYKILVEGQTKSFQDQKDYQIVSEEILLANKDSFYVLCLVSDPKNFKTNESKALQIFNSIDFTYQVSIDGDYAIYESQHYGVRMKYPRGWVPLGANPQYGFITRFFNPEHKDYQINQENISINISVKKDGEEFSSLEEARQVRFSFWEKFSGYQLESEEKTKLAGHDAYKITFSYLQGDGLRIKEVFVFTVFDGLSFGIDVFPLVYLTDEQLNTIVESFEILY